MDFVSWWFDQHFIVSTICTPLLTVAWCTYNEILVRGVAAFLITCIYIFSIFSAVITAHRHQ